MIATRPTHNKRPLRLLIADPVDHSRHSIASYLQLQCSLEVVAATALAAEAIALTRQYQPEIVIIDTNPPDMDGFSAARRLLALDPPPVVILLSTHWSAREKRRARLSGAAAYISRSAGVDEILDTLRSLSNSVAEELSVSN